MILIFCTETIYVKRFVIYYLSNANLLCRVLLEIRWKLIRHCLISSKLSNGCHPARTLYAVHCTRTAIRCSRKTPFSQCNIRHNICPALWLVDRTKQRNRLKRPRSVRLGRSGVIVATIIYVVWTARGKIDRQKPQSSSRIYVASSESHLGNVRAVHKSRV